MSFVLGHTLLVDKQLSLLQVPYCGFKTGVTIAKNQIRLNNHSYTQPFVHGEEWNGREFDSSSIYMFKASLSFRVLQ